MAVKGKKRLVGSALNPVADFEKSPEETAAEKFVDLVKHPEKRKAKKMAGTEKKRPGENKIQAELVAISHILDKEGGRLLAVGVRFVLGSEVAERMHPNVKDAFRMVNTEGSIKRIIIDSKEWPTHGVKFFDTPDSTPGLQLQDVVIRNVRVFRKQKENESTRMIQFDVTAPVAACGQWPHTHYRADVWLTFGKQQGSLFEAA